MNNYPSQDIHLSSNQGSLRIAQMISFAGGIVILFSAAVLSFDFFFKFSIFEKTLVNTPTIAALILGGVEIFLYKKSKIFQLLGIPLAAIGLITIFDHFMNLGIVSYFSADNLKAGMVFLIIGLGFLVSILNIPHRYHLMQLTILLALSVVLFGFLESLYQILSFGRIVSVEDNSIFRYLIFFILCQSTILSRPDRGFIGIFTTDSRSSQLARMALVYYAILPPVLGIFVLIIGKVGLSLYTSLALLTVMVMITSVVISWINVKLLYPSEVDHYLMRESLRINNISLELNADDLSSKVSELEEEKRNVTDKYNNQQTLSDLVDKTG